jgi:hypothetical protein
MELDLGPADTDPVVQRRQDLRSGPFGHHGVDGSGVSIQLVGRVDAQQPTGRAVDPLG